MEKMKISKRDFEMKINTKFKNLSCCRYSENGIDKHGNPKITNMTLYYDNDKHVATWCNGMGWTLKQPAVGE